MDDEEGLNGLYKQSKRLILTLQHQIEQLETGEDTSVFIQGRISSNINSLSRLTQNLQSMKRNLPDYKKEIWDMYVVIHYLQ